MDFNLETKNEFVFDEKGNTILSLREEAWNGKQYKLAMRKCYIDKEGNESPNKGFAFLTEQGPHMLTEELVRRGYGDTQELVSILKERGEDTVTEDISDLIQEEEYYDPKDIFGVGAESDD